MSRTLMGTMVIFALAAACENSSPPMTDGGPSDADTDTDSDSETGALRSIWEASTDS